MRAGVVSHPPRSFCFDHYDYVWFIVKGVKLISISCSPYSIIVNRTENHSSYSSFKDSERISFLLSDITGSESGKNAVWTHTVVPENFGLEKRKCGLLTSYNDFGRSLWKPTHCVTTEISSGKHRFTATLNPILAHNL